MFLLIVLSLFSLAGLTIGAMADPRIVGGQAIPIAMVPYQVSIRFISEDNQVFGNGAFCGGAFIKNSVVLTAAHCFYDKGKLITPGIIQVVGGHANLNVRDNYTFVSAVSSFKIHESYKNDNFAYDVAIIKLKSNATFSGNSTVQLINLPTKPYPVGSSCLISGWGATLFEGPGSIVLRGANVTINNSTECNRSNYLNGAVKSGMFCAGPFRGGIDACQGDSGGPLNCNNIIYGVTSHGWGCASIGKPGIYTDVYYYREWILKNSTLPNINKLQMLFVSTILIILSCVRLL